jgi:hypothetical protein
MVYDGFHGVEILGNKNPVRGVTLNFFRRLVNFMFSSLLSNNSRVWCSGYMYVLHGVSLSLPFVLTARVLFTDKMQKQGPRLQPFFNFLARGTAFRLYHGI